MSFSQLRRDGEALPIPHRPRCCVDEASVAIQLVGRRPFSTTPGRDLDDAAAPLASCLLCRRQEGPSHASTSVLTVDHERRYPQEGATFSQEWDAMERHQAPLPVGEQHQVIGTEGNKTVLNDLGRSRVSEFAKELGNAGGVFGARATSHVMSMPSARTSAPREDPS